MALPFDIKRLGIDLISYKVVTSHQHSTKSPLTFH